MLIIYAHGHSTQARIHAILLFIVIYSCTSFGPLVDDSNTIYCGQCIALG